MYPLIINARYGLAGDILTSALISLGVPHVSICRVMLDAALFLGGAKIEIKTLTRADLKGIFLEIALTAPPPSTEGELIKQQLQTTLDKWQIAGAYRDYATRAITYLIKAEEAAHSNHTLFPGHSHHHHCHLHEAQDILIDVMGTTWALQHLQIDLDNITCLTPVITGRGKVKFSHGTLDVPAPATAALIQEHKIPAADGGLDTELLTPTGAALLAAFGAHYADRDEFVKSDSEWEQGIGFGTKDLTTKLGTPNALTVYRKK